MRKLFENIFQFIKVNRALFIVIFVALLFSIATGKFKNLDDIPLAWDKDASPSTLIRLAGDPRVTIRTRIAGNPKTPPIALEKLAEDSDIVVRFEVVENPNASLIALCKLVNDNYKEISSIARERLGLQIVSCK